MPETTKHTKYDLLRKQLEGVARAGSRASPALSQALEAVQGIFTAVDYNDAALIKSYGISAFEALRDLVRDAIQEQVGMPNLVRETLRQVWEAHAKPCPGENFDQLGREIESFVDGQLTAMISLRDGPVKYLLDKEYQVEQAAQLSGAIDEIRKLKEDVLKEWPWSHRSLPPVNREMVAESRAAIARKEGEPIQDLIRRLGGDSSAKGG